MPGKKIMRSQLFFLRSYGCLRDRRLLRSGLILRLSIDRLLVLRSLLGLTVDGLLILGHLLGLRLHLCC